MVSLRIAGVWVSGGGVPGSGVREMAKGRGERVEGVLVVLMRVRDRALGLCPELSTATARWRPAEPWGARGTGRRGPARRQGGGGGRARRVGGQSEQEVAGLALHGGDDTEQGRRGAEQAGRLEEGEKGPICNFRNFRDLTVN